MTLNVEAEPEDDGRWIAGMPELPRVMAAANARAREEGVDVPGSLVSVSQRLDSPDDIVWRVSYGPRNYIGRRGDDVIVEVGGDADVRQVLFGQ